MAHSYSRNHIHLVFSTKWAYLAGACKNYEMNMAWITTRNIS